MLLTAEKKKKGLSNALYTTNIAVSLNWVYFKDFFASAWALSISLAFTENGKTFHLYNIYPSYQSHVSLATDPRHPPASALF